MQTTVVLTRNRGSWVAGLLFAAILLPSVTVAQDAATFPSRPVTIVMPFPPGGPSEKESRLYATKLQSLLGQPFVMEYKPGAAGTIAAAQVARAKPDGYTILVVTGGFTTIPSLYKDLPFDPVKDFAPISLMTQRTSVLLINPNHPAKTLPEYLAYAKANPGKVNYATVGAGGIAHLGAAWLHSAANVSVTYLFYKGGAALMLDLIEGRLDATSAPLLSVLPQIKAGKLRALGLMNDRRSDLLPGVRTVAEQGVPGFNYASWYGLVAPGATPAAIVNKLSENLAITAKAPEVAAPLEAEGSFMVGSTPAEFRRVILTETATWKKVVAEAGIKLEE